MATYTEQAINELGQDYFKASRIYVGNSPLANFRTDGVDDWVQIKLAVDKALIDKANGKTSVIEFITDIYPGYDPSLTETFGSVVRRLSVQLKDEVVFIIPASITIFSNSGGNSGGVFYTVFGNFGNLTGAKIVCENINSFDGQSTIAGSATDRHGAVWLDARSNGCTVLTENNFLITGKNFAGEMVKAYNSNLLGNEVATNNKLLVLQADGNYRDLSIERNGTGLSGGVLSSKNALQNSVYIKDGVDANLEIRNVVDTGDNGAEITTDTSITTKFNNLNIVGGNVSRSGGHNFNIKGCEGSIDIDCEEAQKAGVNFEEVLSGATNLYPKSLTLNVSKSINNNQGGVGNHSGIQGVIQQVKISNFNVSDTQSSPTQYRGINFNNVKCDYIYLSSGISQNNTDTNNQIAIKGVNSRVEPSVIGFNRIVSVSASTTKVIDGPEDLYLISNDSILTLPTFSSLGPVSGSRNLYKVKCILGIGSVKAGDEGAGVYKQINGQTIGTPYYLEANQSAEFNRFSDRWRTYYDNFGDSAGQTLTPAGTTQTIDLNLGAYVILDTTSATGNITLTINNPLAYSSYLIEVRQGATARNLIFPTNTSQAGIAAGTDNTYTASGTNRVDLISMVYNGTSFRIGLSENHQTIPA